MTWRFSKVTGAVAAITFVVLLAMSTRSRLTADEQRLLGEWHNPTDSGVHMVELLPDRRLVYSTLSSSTRSSTQSDLRDDRRWHLDGDRVVVTLRGAGGRLTLGEVIARAKGLCRWPPQNPLRSRELVECWYEIESKSGDPYALTYHFNGCMLMPLEFCDADVYCRTEEAARWYDEHAKARYQELMDSLANLEVSEVVASNLDRDAE